MAIEIWNPFEDLADWSRQVRKSVKSMGTNMWMPTIDVYSKNNDLIVEAELPGVNKDEVDVSVSEKMLMISGERKQEEKVEEENYYRMESSYGKFQRSISLPVEVKPEDIKASFKNGVLKVVVPGAGKEAPKKTKIDIEAA